jgi:lipopolysaccharide export system permease protein
MQKVSGYILRRSTVAFLFVTLSLVCAIWLMQSLRLIDLIVNRGLPFSMFFYMSMLMLPTFLALILPVSLFTAVLFAYNRLTMDSELLVMRAAGISQTGLSKSAFLLAGIVTVIIYSLTLYLLPLSFREFKDRQVTIRNDFSTVLLQEGVFTELAMGITVFVRERGAEGELLGVLVHDGRNPEKPVTMMAENGALVRTDEGPQVIMVNGNRQEVSKDSGALSLLYFDRYVLDVHSVDKTLDKRWREPRERFLDELFFPDMTDGNNRFNAAKLRAEGHQRLTLPIYALTFTVIALAALLSGDYARRGLGKRITTAILLIVAIQGAALGFTNLAARFPWLVPLIYLNAMLPLIGGIIVLFRPKKHTFGTVDQTTYPA